MKAQGPSHCWIWSGGLAARLDRDMARLSEKNGSFWGQKSIFSKYLETGGESKERSDGLERRPKGRPKGPLIFRFGAGGLAARLDRDMARLGEKNGSFGVKKSIFSKYLGTGGEPKERSGGLKWRPKDPHIAGFGVGCWLHGWAGIRPD